MIDYAIITNCANRSEILVGQLEAFCKQMSEELTNYLKSSKNVQKGGKNMTSTMKTIVWITQSENTVCCWRSCCFPYKKKNITQKM